MIIAIFSPSQALNYSNQKILLYSTSAMKFVFSFFFPMQILVIGGGDGGILREAAKHPMVEEIHLCEIDEVLLNQTIILCCSYVIIICLSKGGYIGE